jgi:hypothetical protein
MGYTIILFPVCLISALVFCLPCVLISLRWFQRVTGINLVGANPDALWPTGGGGGREGLSQDLINKLPIFTFLPKVPRPVDDTKSEQAGDVSPKSEPSKEEVELKHSPLVLAEEDAQCSICLVEFESGCELRQLPCKHYYHLACIDQWLTLNTTCPLCVRDLRDDLVVDPERTEGGAPRGEEAV